MSRYYNFYSPNLNVFNLYDLVFGRKPKLLIDLETVPIVKVLRNVNDDTVKAHNAGPQMQNTKYKREINKIQIDTTTINPMRIYKRILHNLQYPKEYYELLSK